MKTSMIDYEKNIVSTIFVSGCNFRCGFCHNPELVFDEKEKDIPVDEVLDFLKTRSKWIDGICITGGEPTLHSGLKAFIKKVKVLGLKVKLDTNGTNPDLIKELIEEGLLDQVAMDIKSSIDRYDEVAGVKAPKDKIKESINLLLNSNIDAYFRTTILPRHYDEGEARKIGAMLTGAKKYVLQCFKNHNRTLSPDYQDEKVFLGKDLEKFREIMQEYVKNVEVRY